MDKVSQELEKKQLELRKKIIELDDTIKNVQNLKNKKMYDLDLEYEDDYATNSYIEEQKKNNKKKRQIQNRKFASYLIGSFAILLIGTNVITYKIGKQNGMKEKEEQIFESVARTCNITNAQPKILMEWANYSVGKLENYVENTRIPGGNENLEIIKREYLSKVYIDYENIIKSNGNMKEYSNLVNDVIKLENELNYIGYNIDFSFSKVSVNSLNSDNFFFKFIISATVEVISIDIKIIKIVEMYEIYFGFIFSIITVMAGFNIYISNKASTPNSVELSKHTLPFILNFIFE